MAKQQDEQEKARKGQEAQGSGRRWSDDDPTGQPTDPVRSQPDESGARMAEEKGDDPAHGTARTAKSDGPVPRVVQPVERAPEGFQRFKIRGDSHGVNTTRYVLAKKGDRAGAEAHYRKIHKLDEAVQRERDALKAAGLSDDRLEPVRLVTVELPD